MLLIKSIMTFPFEHLDIYQKSLEWVAKVEDFNESIRGKISYALVDQLSRASLSIPLNIAEGNGRWHKGEKRQFFWIARGSVFECVPIIQVLRQRGLLDDKLYIDYYEHLEIMAKMLTNLVKSVDELDR